MVFPPKPGCPICSIVSSASHTTPNSPRSPAFPLGSTQPEVLWRDDNFTAYRERAHPISTKGHIIIAFNLHVPSLYTMSSADLPLLVSLQALAVKLLSALVSTSLASRLPCVTRGNEFRIGFITPPFKDSKIPIGDHLHAHAYVHPADLLGWWRSVAYSSIAWYDIKDLIAEIRESVSNNRVKSGYSSGRAIDLVPAAGARTGTSDGVETTELGIASLSTTIEDAGVLSTMLSRQSGPRTSL
ncbi:hypothetical protein FA15DRAFT_690088 [Coprinopsis marcescibilis]|uniref:HIT domain-containing protein n=1 Tax=Coprinopsis marcescibilis TaxID=230819 RepID=A0A5C3LC27_COPMA|nr:hypothetical protein FA15DRAFT_690088 [Coprinopsis marcescibilis]